MDKSNLAFDPKLNEPSIDADDTDRVKAAAEKNTTAFGGDEKATLDRLTGEYCVVDLGGKARVMSFRTVNGRNEAHLSTFNDFADLNNHHQIVASTDNKGNPKLMPLGTWWLRHPKHRQYSGIVFDPSGAEEINGQINLWRGFGVEVKAGDCSLMRTHILKVIACGNKDHAEYIEKWLAFAVQHPEKLAEVALVLKGKKGTGKGFVGRVMREIFGQHGLHISAPGQLAGKHNAHLRDCCYLFADEAFWPGEKAAEGTLKRTITEPTLFIEPKGIDAFEVPNMLHILMASNAEWVVPATMADERRFAVFEISDSHRGDNKYFEALFHEKDNGGKEAFLHYLLNVDLKGYHPRKDIPQTKALDDQKMESLEPFDAFMQDLFDAGHLPSASEDLPNRTRCTPLLEAESKWGISRRKIYMTEKAFVLALKKKYKVMNPKSNGVRWLLFPPLSECRAIFKATMPSITWSNDQKNWEIEKEVF